MGDGPEEPLLTLQGSASTHLSLSHPLCTGTAATLARQMHKWVTR